MVSLQAGFEQVVTALRTKCNYFVNIERLTEKRFGYKMYITIADLSVGCLQERKNTMDSGSIPGRSTQFKKPFPGVCFQIAG